MFEGNIGTLAQGLSMAFAEGRDYRAGLAGFGKSKKNKEKIRD
jgi:hypothetical protein